MKFEVLIKTFCLLAFMVLINCKTDKSQIPPDLGEIDLLRGDLVLCSGKSFGNVSFSLSCDYSIREGFNLATALLHSFQYAEAEKAFVKVLDMDPQCAMAYWGVAMSIYHALWFEPNDKDLEKGSKLIAIAEGLPQSDKEKMYIGALSTFYSDWQNVDHKTRAKRYELKMEDLYKSFREDTEAAIFYTLALKSTADPSDVTYSNESKAGAILEGLLVKYPDHPGIAHYIIHNYDNPVLAPKALSTARKYAQIAPSSSHAQHMPSHIFTRLGLWDESIESNINSASSSQCYTQELGIEGAYFEEIHAIDYLVYAYLQKGDNKKAQEQYEYIKKMSAVNKANLPAVVYPFAAIPARLALENKNWTDAAKISLHESEIDWQKFPWQKAIIHYARALGTSHIKDFKQTEKEIVTLEKLREDILASGDTYKAEQILIQIKAAKAWLALKSGKSTSALQLMSEAASLEHSTSKHPVTPGEVLPAQELLGDMLLTLNKFSEALEAYEKNLVIRPNRFNSLLGAARAAVKIGDKKKALFYYHNLLTLVDGSESTRPELHEAQKFVKSI